MTSMEFAQSITQMRQTLYNITYSMLDQECDRNDAVQEALAKAWQKRGTLREERYLKTWVVRILINECHAIHRKRARELPMDEIPERQAPPDADTDVHDAVMALEEDLRLPVLLYYIEGYPVGEIAGMMRLRTGTVKSRLHRARGKLKLILQEKEEAGHEPIRQA